MSQFSFVIAGLAAVALVACSQPAPAPAPEPAPAPVEAKAPPASVIPTTVVDAAIGDARLSTLVAAVQAAGLVETLSGPGPFTVFAPTNEAFAAIQADVDALLANPDKAPLTGVLTFHVVPGKILSTDLAGVTATPATVQGGALSVDTTDGVFVGGARVLQADIEVGNGVVHIIDKVLLP